MINWNAKLTTADGLPVEIYNADRRHGAVLRPTGDWAVAHWDEDGRVRAIGGHDSASPHPWDLKNSVIKRGFFSSLYADGGYSFGETKRESVSYVHGQAPIAITAFSIQCVEGDGLDGLTDIMSRVGLK